jgi:hypothetical protein
MEKRRLLMQMWSDYICDNENKVIHAFPKIGDLIGN